MIIEVGLKRLKYEHDTYASSLSPVFIRNRHRGIMIYQEHLLYFVIHCMQSLPTLIDSKFHIYMSISLWDGSDGIYFVYIHDCVISYHFCVS